MHEFEARKVIFERLKKGLDFADELITLYREQLKPADRQLFETRVHDLRNQMLSTRYPSVRNVIQLLNALEHMSHLPEGEYKSDLASKLLADDQGEAGGSKLQGH